MSSLCQEHTGHTIGVLGLRRTMPQGFGGSGWSEHCEVLALQWTCSSKRFWRNFGRIPHVQGVKSVGTIVHRALGRVKWKKRRRVGTILAFGGMAGLIS